MVSDAESTLVAPPNPWILWLTFDLCKAAVSISDLRALWTTRAV